MVIHRQEHHRGPCCHRWTRNLMNSYETLESIRAINLSYLMLAPRMLHEDRIIGMSPLGLSMQPTTLCPDSHSPRPSGLRHPIS